MRRKRRDDELPWVAAVLGWRYHHIGVPRTEPHAREHHIEHLGVHVCGFETSPYGIEWMRFDPDCQVPEIVKAVPHVAFVVDDLAAALEGREVLVEPNSPSPGVRVAFILDDGAPIELLEFSRASDHAAVSEQAVAADGRRARRPAKGEEPFGRGAPS